MNLKKIIETVILSQNIIFSICDIKIISPKENSVFHILPNHNKIKLEWEDDKSESDFDLSKVKFHSISLCTGKDTDLNCFKNLVDSEKIENCKKVFVIQTKMCADGMYFFQIFTLFEEGLTIHYSPRFKLVGMNGINSNNLNIHDTGPSPPPWKEHIKPEIKYDTLIANLPYNQQTGNVKYAPMQLQPGSEVIHTTWSNRYPVTSVSIFKTIINSISILTTLTPPWDYTIESDYNWATPAPFPTHYYPASEKVRSATLNLDKKKKKSNTNEKN